MSYSWYQRECFQPFTIECDVSCELVLFFLSYVEVYSFYTYFVESFYHEKMLNFVKCFDMHVDMIIQFLSLLLLCGMVYHIY